MPIYPMHSTTNDSSNATPPIFESKVTLSHNHITDSLKLDNISSVCQPIVLPPLKAPGMAECKLPFSLVTGLTIKQQAYPYTHDLLLLEQFSPHSRELPAIPNISSIASPLISAAWETALHDHPDQDLCAFIGRGITRGFRIGYDSSHRRQSAAKNMPSAMSNPEPVDQYLQTEVAEGRIIGPLPASFRHCVHVNCFGVIPKRHKPNRWRLITDLSSPHGKSINDGICKDLCSLQYESVDDAARIIMDWGEGTQLAKIDIAHAYRNVPIHPADRCLLGMEWKGSIYIDTALPFGLRSAPKVFCALSDALEWILLQAGITACLHYIDEFLTFGHPNSSECQHNLEVLKSECSNLGVPLAEEKIEGPVTSLTFLGIELDTTRMIMCLPEGKLQSLRRLIEEWTLKRAATKRAMLSLIGELAHAAKVVAPGRTFLRRMILCANSRNKLDHWIRTKEFRSDLFWWHVYIQQWNGVSLLAAHVHRPPDYHTFTDASGSWGCGAVTDQLWFQCPWSPSWEGVNIATKEMVPIVLAVAVWGERWLNRHVLIRSDNWAVVEIL